MKVLLLEDEYLLSQSIRKYLLIKNCFVDSFDNGKDVLDIIHETEYDFFVLDINTPIVGGLECLKVISELYPKTPKIVISAYHDIDHIAVAFELGCSDYLKKPFNLKELDIRIEKLSSIKSETTTLESSAFVVLSENYKYSRNDKMLYYKDEIQKFSKREHALISFFVSNLNQVVGDEMIHSSVWDCVETKTSTVRSLVNRLRSKLHEDIIENIRGFGYMMKIKKE